MLLNIAIGTAFVVAMALLARTSIVWLNGLIPLFPTFALIGQMAIYYEKGDQAARDAAVVGLMSLAPYVAYLLTILFLSKRRGFPVAAVAGVGFWLVLAAGIVALRVHSGPL